MFSFSEKLAQYWIAFYICGGKVDVSKHGISVWLRIWLISFRVLLEINMICKLISGKVILESGVGDNIKLAEILLKMSKN